MSPTIGPLLGSGNVAEVFEYGPHVLKLYKSPNARATAFAEAAVTAIVGSHGLPVPEIVAAGNYDGRWGLVMGRAPDGRLADHAEANPSTMRVALQEMVRLHLLIHSKTEIRLPRLKPRLADRIALAPGLDAALRGKLLADLAHLPDGAKLCHGDFHPYNIMGAPGATMIVDWPDATSGPPQADVCRSYLLMHQAVPALASAYLDGYLAQSDFTKAEVLAWLPVLAAARLAEGIAAEEQSLLALARGGAP